MTHKERLKKDKGRKWEVKHDTYGENHKIKQEITKNPNPDSTLQTDVILDWI